LRMEVRYSVFAIVEVAHFTQMATIK